MATAAGETVAAAPMVAGSTEAAAAQGVRSTRCRRRISPAAVAAQPQGECERRQRPRTRTEQAVASKLRHPGLRQGRLLRQRQRAQQQHAQDGMRYEQSTQSGARNLCYTCTRSRRGSSIAPRDSAPAGSVRHRWLQPSQCHQWPYSPTCAACGTHHLYTRKPVLPAPQRGASTESVVTSHEKRGYVLRSGGYVRDRDVGSPDDFCARARPVAAGVDDDRRSCSAREWCSALTRGARRAAEKIRVENSYVDTCRGGCALEHTHGWSRRATQSLNAPVAPRSCRA